MIERCYQCGAVIDDDSEPVTLWTHVRLLGMWAYLKILAFGLWTLMPFGDDGRRP